MLEEAAAAVSAVNGQMWMDGWMLDHLEATLAAVAATRRTTGETSELRRLILGTGRSGALRNGD